MFGTPYEIRSTRFCYSFLRVANHYYLLCSFRFVNLIIECDKNSLDRMCHLGASQLIIVYQIQFFCARWTSQVQGFGFPKRLMRKKRVLSILFRNLWFTRTNGRYRLFENGKAKKANKICTTEPGGVFKGEDIGLDVQELTGSIETA